MTTPQLPAVVEPAKLTAALRNAGALDAGAVREVKVLSSRDTIVSHITRLGLRYVGESDGAPQSLILKMPHPRLPRRCRMRGRHEVAFYTKLAPKMPARDSCRAASTGISTRKASPGICCSKISPIAMRSRPHGRCRRRGEQAIAIVADARALARSLVGSSQSRRDSRQLDERRRQRAAHRKHSLAITIALPICSATVSARSGATLYPPPHRSVGPPISALPFAPPSQHHPWRCP